MLTFFENISIYKTLNLVASWVSLGEKWWKL